MRLLPFLLALACTSCTYADVDCQPAAQIESDVAGGLRVGTTPAGIERCGDFTWNRTDAQDCICDGPLEVGCACLSDLDCGAGQACLCSAGVADVERVLANRSACVPAACRSADDCGGDSCGVAITAESGVVSGLRCRSDMDLCASDADCAQADGCFYAPLGGWHCDDPFSTCE